MVQSQSGEHLPTHPSGHCCCHHSLCASDVWYVVTTELHVSHSFYSSPLFCGHDMKLQCNFLKFQAIFDQILEKKCLHL